MRRVSGVLAVVACVALAACNNSSGTKGAASTTSTGPTTPTTIEILHPPTNLTVNGYSPGVNEAPFYATATITTVTCPAASVTFTVPAGGAGSSPNTAMTVATTVVVTNGKAELRDSSGKVLYSETSKSLTIAGHGSLVLSMVPVASTDAGGRRVAAGSVNVGGDYLCP